MGQEGSEDSGSDSEQNNQSDSDSKSDNPNSTKSNVSSGSDSDSKSDKSPAKGDAKSDTDDGKSNNSGKRNPSSGSDSSDSDSGSGSSKSGSSSKSESEQTKVKEEPRENAARKKTRRRTSSELQPLYEKHPDLYGIRRSGRSRKEPERLTAESDSSDRGKKKNKLQWNSGSSSSEEYNSDTDQEIPSSKPLSRYRVKPNLRARAVQKQKAPSRTKKRFSSSDDESSESEEDTSRRHNSRRANTVSYKEDSDEKTDSDDVLEVDNGETQDGPAEAEAQTETIEKVIAQRRGKIGVVGNQTTIYAVEENGDPNEGCDPNDLQNTEMQYLIKWKGWSHIHNTWESETSLKAQKVKGMKKVENFIKREEEIAKYKELMTPEDSEYFECQQELQQDLQKSYNFVERIIAEIPTAESREYFVKWQSLPYADATWEDAALIERKWPDSIREFREREDSKKTPSKMCKALKYRPKFNQLNSQPSYLAGGSPDATLRDYQLHGVNWLIHTWCKENSVILADEMGLGKTIQTISFLYYLFNTHQVYGPFLVVVPLSTMTSWQREFSIWAPDINVVTYIGDVTSRDFIREYEWCFANTKRLKFNAVLTTYEILLKDKAFLGSLNWAVLMVDEAHRLKNDDSLLYKALTEFVTNHRLLITGTPLQNSLKELWALLHFIMPNKFETWEEFEKDHENAANKGYAKLHKQLEPFILRRVKKDVEKSLPAKVEQILRVEMTSSQKQFYRWILTKNFDALRKGAKGSTSTFLNIVIELKKCCNHSLLIKQPDSELGRSSVEDQLQQLIRGSGKLVLLDKLLMRLRETGHRVLIFSQMVRMLDILAEYLQMRHFPFQRLDGGIKGEIRRQALDHFNAENSQDFCFLLSTRAGGLGINLATADTVIIFDSDWNPQNDLQAQARAHRIGQKNQVNIYRLVTKSSVEEDIVERAKKKMVLDHLVIQRMDTTGRTVLDKKSSGSSSTPFNKDELTAILKFGAADLFKDDEAGDEEPACDIDEILKRAETRDEAPVTVGDELLSAFKMANFIAVEEEEEPPSENEPEDDHKEWDEIIPENFRAKVEQEEKEKELADSYLPPRSRKTLQQLNQFDSDGEGGKKRGANKRKKEDSAASTGEESDEDRPRKRGRPRASARDPYKGFTDVEIRRFVKSFKKFPAPMKRLEAIACDAELQEKSLAELHKLGTYLHEQCENAMNEANATEPAQPEKTGPGRKKCRASFKIGGVAVNAKTMLTCEKDLEPLDKVLPANAEERSRWTLDAKVKYIRYGERDWDIEDDSKLLRGIYQHGMGNWEAIKSDTSLGLEKKILLPEDKEPGPKELQKRADYLLKILRKQMNVDDASTSVKNKRGRKAKEGRETKYISKDTIEHDDSSDDDSPPKASNDEASQSTNNKDDKKTKKDASKSQPKKRKNISSGPLHITANSEPVAIGVIGDLDPTIFNQCKEIMRPVKKALRALDRPDETLSQQEQVIQTRKCLLEIGEQIDKCLLQYKDPDTIKEWRSNLWYFVSKFTEFEPKRLFKLYKHALKKLKDKSESKSVRTESSPPAKRRKLEDKTEKKPTPENSKSPLKHRSEKPERAAEVASSAREVKSEPSESAVNRDTEERLKHRERNRERDRDRDRERDRDRDRERDRDRDRERERSKKDSLMANASAAHQYRPHDPRAVVSNNLARSHDNIPPERWHSSSSGYGPESKRKRYDNYPPRTKSFPREHESHYGRDYPRLHPPDKRRFSALPSAPAYPYGVPYFSEPAAAAYMYSRGDGRYAQAPLPGHPEWYSMMGHDRVDHHRDYDRRPPPTSNS